MWVSPSERELTVGLVKIVYQVIDMEDWEYLVCCFPLQMPRFWDSSF